MLSRHSHYVGPQGFIHAACQALCLPGLYFMLYIKHASSLNSSFIFEGRHN